MTPMPRITCEISPFFHPTDVSLRILRGNLVLPEVSTSFLHANAGYRERKYCWYGIESDCFLLPGLCTEPRVETPSYTTVQKRLETDHPMESYVFSRQWLFSRPFAKRSAG